MENQSNYLRTYLRRKKPDYKSKFLKRFSQISQIIKLKYIRKNIQILRIHKTSKTGN